MNLVTYPHKVNDIYRAKAESMARQLNWSIVERQGLSADLLCKTYGCKSFMLYTKQGPTLYNQNGEKHFFHLSMAHLRILKLQRNENDYMIKAIKKLYPSEGKISLLDATCGFGSDSIVASYYFKDNIDIIALEKFQALAYITNYGFRNFIAEDISITQALRAIRLYNMDFMDYLQNCKDKSFDIIYFDPMFEKAVSASSQFIPLREEIMHTALNTDIWQEALRVARLGIIVKERSFSSLFEQLKITNFVGGKYSRIKYGLYHCK